MHWMHAYLSQQQKTSWTLTNFVRQTEMETEKLEEFDDLVFISRHPLRAEEVQ